VDELQEALRDLLPNLPFDDASKGVPVADDWKTTARSILRTCDALVCVVGPDTHSSEPVDWEIREAHGQGKPLLVAQLAEDHELPPCCYELGIAPVLWKTSSLAGQLGELLVFRALFPHEYDPVADSNMLWNQYSVMVDSWERLIARRQTVNTLYVSASAALLAGVGALVSVTGRASVTGQSAGVAVLACIGAALGFNWRRTIVSYGTLSRAKSKVVAALESKLPARLFDAEWRVLEARRYKSTTETDRQTATFFLLLFLAIAAVALGSLAAQALLRS
jgi:hypothetical protein